MSSADQIDSVRSKGVNIMIKIRDGSDAGDTSVREFVVPKLNWLAMDYTEIIDFSNVKITEPVLAAHLLIPEIEAIRETPLKVKPFPNNNQGLERLVKQTTQASKSVFGFEAQYGLN